MTVSVGLLRAVNVGGRNKVAMADLRELLARLGMRDARTLLQSGNVVFRSDMRASADVEVLLEEAVRKRLGLDIDIMVRTASDWKAIVAGNPFPKEAEQNPSHLLVMCLKQEPDREDVRALQGAIAGHEVVRAKGRQAYIVYPDDIGRSRLTGALIEKKLGTRGTARNWNTVLKLEALAEAL